MKRLLGTVGLTYLSLLAVVFYLRNAMATTVAIALSLLSVLLGLFFRVIIRKGRKTKTIGNNLMLIGISALCACISLIICTDCVYQPVVDKYSDRELFIEGYISDGVQKRQNSNLYYITTEKINGENAQVKISLVSTQDLKAEDFDCITAKLTVNRATDNYMLSRSVFLTSYYDENSILNATGEKHFSLYSLAVGARKEMENSLEVILPEQSSSMCKAVLLGEKYSLSTGVRNDFSKTGASFLIVVSGMHLAIITAFVLFLLRRFTRNRYILCAFVTLFVICFMAITGFYPSVIRAGIMVIITYCSSVFFRRADGINSLGAAALVLTLTNPYSVGDIGMLLSFSATAGIILWEPKIHSYICRKLHLNNGFLKSCASIISVSISASLWVLPVTTIAFGTASPLVVFISFICEPLVSVILVCSMLTALLFIIPLISFAAYPFALVAALLSKVFLKIISAFASIPYSSVNSAKPYFYIWLIVTALLVITGYAIKAKGFYIRCAVAVSAVTLTLGWAVYAFTESGIVRFKVYNAGNGVTASIECGGNISFISCGGDSDRGYNIVRGLSGNFTSIDNIIIPNTKLKYSRYLPQLLSEVDSSNILVYDNNSEEQNRLQNYDGNMRTVFGENCHFSISVNPLTTIDVINVNSVTYQYISANGTSILFAPSRADISKLPEKFRSCDYLLIDSAVKNISLIYCDEVIFSGSRENLAKNYNSIKEITDTIHTTSDKTAEFVFNGG